MKQLILKELREHAKVAVLGLAILSVILIYAFSAYSSEIERVALATYSYGAGKTLQPLLAEALLVQISIFCGIFGALLGWLQIRAEKHPDLWAFLIHRPLPRTTILWSKVIAGLLVYAVGAGLPLLGFIIVVVMPGNVAAPFAWAMTLPIVAAFLVGILYYFGGLLTGLRKARWYASRGFALGLAIIANLAVFALPEFWQVLLTIVLAGLVLAVAVWGSFQTGGYFRDQPTLAKVALTISSVVAGVLLIGVVVAGSSILLAPRVKYTISQYQLGKDGTIYKVTHTGYEAPEIVDLNGRPLLDEKTGKKISPQGFSRRVAPGLSTFVHFGNVKKRNPYRQRYLGMARFFNAWRVYDKTLWYLTSDGRLVAYHGITRRFVGSLEPQTSAEDFLHRREYSYLQAYTQPEVLASAKTAYLVDLEKSALKPLFTVTNGDAIGGYAQTLDSLAGAFPHRALVATRTSIRLLDFEGKTLMHVPYDPAYPSYPSVGVHWLEATNTFAVRFDPDFWLNKKAQGKLLTRIEWVGADNTISKTIDLPKLPEPRSSDRFIEQLLSALLPPAIPFYLWEGSQKIWTLFRIVLAALCVLAGWWLGRGHNFSLKAKVGWAIFHLFCGIPGLLAFLAVQEWPAREPCPVCGKLRVVDRKQCEHCGGLFAPPQKTGIEIFEPLTTR